MLCTNEVLPRQALEVLGDDVMMMEQSSLLFLLLARIDMELVPGVARQASSMMIHLT